MHCSRSTLFEDQYQTNIIRRVKNGTTLVAVRYAVRARLMNFESYPPAAVSLFLNPLANECEVGGDVADVTGAKSQVSRFRAQEFRAHERRQRSAFVSLRHLHRGRAHPVAIRRLSRNCT